MNKTELAERVRDYLNRPGVSDASISAWISSTEGELNRLLRDHPRMWQTVTITQAAEDPMLPLPADLIQAVVLRTSERQYVSAPQTRREEAIATGGMFISHGNSLELFPTPTEETAFILDYLGAIDPLELAEDENWVSLYFGDVYLYGCLKEASIYLKDKESQTLWTQEFTNRVSSLAAQGWDQNVFAAPRVV